MWALAIFVISSMQLIRKLCLKVRYANTKALKLPRMNSTGKLDAFSYGRRRCNYSSYVFAAF